MTYNADGVIIGTVQGTANQKEGEDMITKEDIKKAREFYGLYDWVSDDWIRITLVIAVNLELNQGNYEGFRNTISPFSWKKW